MKLEEKDLEAIKHLIQLPETEFCMKGVFIYIDPRRNKGGYYIVKEASIRPPKDNEMFRNVDNAIQQFKILVEGK